MNITKKRWMLMSLALSYLTHQIKKIHSYYACIHIRQKDMISVKFHSSKIRNDKLNSLPKLPVSKNTLVCVLNHI